MRNSYPGICYRCNEAVKPNEGHFEIIPRNLRKNNNKWRLQHAWCAIYFRGSKVGKELDNKLLTTTE